MKVVIINKRTKEETVLETGLTEKQADSICEAWGWNYIDENCVSYWIEYRED